MISNLFEINWGLDNLYFPREVTDLAHWSDGLEPTNPLISHSVTTASECYASPDTKLQQTISALVTSTVVICF